jgi:formylglycine-generating enzyme required for sulfatase activity
VQRGGSWVNYQRGYLLSSFRGSSDPGNRFPSFGFRCVLDDSAR